MKTNLKKVVVATIVLAVIFLSGYYILDAGCSATHSCGAWCQTFGHCEGGEKCEVRASSVSCSCGPNLSMGFPCP